MENFDPGQSEVELQRRSKKITEDDLEQILKKGEDIEAKFKQHSPLSRFMVDFKMLFSLIQDYVAGEYLKVPWWGVAAVASALLYVLNPFDLIPDFIPGLGYIDDAMVVAACLRMVEKELLKYQAWKKKREKY